MCGILGYIKFDSKNKKQLTREQIDAAFAESMFRGREATGFFAPNTGVVKDHDDAEDFCKKYRKRLAKAMESPVFIGHTRTATYGFKEGNSSPLNNDNNHPHEGKRFVLVHNGHFSHLPQIKGYKYKGNCDSELALSYVETFGIVRGMELMSKDDKFSLLIYDKVDNVLYWFRETNPLVYAVDYHAGLLLFGSTTDIVFEMTTAIKSPAGVQVADASPMYSSNEKVLYTLRVGEGVVKQETISIRSSDYVLKSIPEAEKLDIKEEKHETYSRSAQSGGYGYTGRGGSVSRHSTFHSGQFDLRRLGVYVALDNGLPMYYKIHDSKKVQPSENTYH